MITNINQINTSKLTEEEIDILKDYYFNDNQTYKSAKHLAAAIIDNFNDEINFDPGVYNCYEDIQGQKEYCEEILHILDAVLER